MGKHSLSHQLALLGREMGEAQASLLSMVFWIMLFTFCSSPDRALFVALTISLLTVREDCARGISAVLINENIKCMIVVAGLTSRM